MTVKDLLLKCDRERLIDIYSGMEDISASKEETEEILAVLGVTEPVYNAEWIILGAEFVDFTGELPSRVNIYLYKISEIKDGFRHCTVSDIRNITRTEYDELSDIISGIESYLIDLDEWENILGYTVDEDNISKFGNERFMAEILWSMTFYGYSEKNIEIKRREYNRAGDEPRNMASEENSVSLGDVAALLFGNDIPDITAFSADEGAISQESAANMYSTYNVIKEFYEKIGF